ncbi:hypothetical protein [Streptomyces sp. NPDC052036]|uniref:hypothetical protein n=1 Tax=Streptomyces sp. NPDC052036 TaxID=3155171 RepID=UPI003430DBB5
MSSDVTCEKLREIGAELALGVLPGRERAEAVAHLDRCAGCREHIGHLTLVGDGLIGLLPGSEPPIGFETRVAQALTQGVSAHERRPHARGSGITHAGLRGRARLRVASAAAAIAIAFGFGGWAVGTAMQDVTATPSQPVESVSGMLIARLTSAGTIGEPTGEVYAHPGNPGWVYMSVNLADAGVPYNGKVSCLLEHADGSTVDLGSFTLHDGYGYYGGPALVDPSALSGARLMSSDGTVLAMAHFQPRT